MKLIILSSLISFSLFATTIEGPEAVLTYSKEVQKSFIFNKSADTKLEVIIENTSFPSRSNLGKAQKKKFVKALSLLEPVLNSAEFKKRVLSYLRPGHTEPGYQKNYLWNNETERLSPSQIYEVIKKADEKMIPNTIAEMNINSWVKVCKWYEKPLTWCSKVVGSTSPSTSKLIKVNWKFYRKFEANQMVSNLVHEWLHLLGFLHGPSSTMRMEVPYIVGQIAGEVAKEMMEGKIALK
jgi:hypothetical protein